MAQLTPRGVRDHLRNVDQAITIDAKGHAFEELACYLCERIPGVGLIERRQRSAFQAEEIDLTCWNDGHEDGLKEPYGVWLVEAKNWSSPVGSAEVGWFLSKLERRGLSFGLLIAAHGLTGDPQELTSAYHVVASYLPKKIQVAVLDRSDLDQLRTSEDLVTTIKRKLLRLHGTNRI